MKAAEFNGQMKRLNEAYKNYYSSERMKIIWATVGEITKEFFEKEVSKALWADFPPKLDWFQNIRSKFYFTQPAVLEDIPHASEKSVFNQNRIREMINSIFQRKES